MYIYVNACIYLLIFVYICSWLYIYIYICIYMFVFAYIYSCLSIFVDTCIYLCFCLHPLLFGYIYFAWLCAEWLPHFCMIACLIVSFDVIFDMRFIALFVFRLSYWLRVGFSCRLYLCLGAFGEHCHIISIALEEVSTLSSLRVWSWKIFLAHD